MFQAKKSVFEKLDEQSNQRTVTLKRRKGENFGFALECANDDGGEFQAGMGYPTVHKIARVVKHSYAYKALLRNGDHVIEINGQDVKSTLYQECVRLIQNTGDTLVLKVIMNSPTKSNDIALLQSPTTVAVMPKRTMYVNVSEFLESKQCIYVRNIDNDMPSVVQCFEIIRPQCENPDGPLDSVFNTIVDEPLTANIFADILGSQKALANILTPYVVDSLKRQHGLGDIISLLPEAQNFVKDDHLANKYESFVDQMTKRMLLVQTLENMSYESQRFLCNFIRKNELPIPLSYRTWNSSEQVMNHKINFNCLLETVCATDLSLLLQFGSPSACGLGKTSLIGYLFNDKRRDFLFTDTTDRVWRDSCVDVLFSSQFIVFDVHGQASDTKLIQSIQPYASVQIVYITNDDLSGEFLQAKAMEFVSDIPTIVVIFDPKYNDNDQDASEQLIKPFKNKFRKWSNVLWTTAPVLNSSQNLISRIIKQRNKRLRETFSHLLEQVKKNAKPSSFRSCLQIQSSFYAVNPSPIPVKLVFEVEIELDRLFSSLSDETENRHLVTPITHLYSQAKAAHATIYESIRTRNVSVESKLYSLDRIIQTQTTINEYHHFTISLLIRRTYIELLIVEAYLERWRSAYTPSLREKKEKIREDLSTCLRQLKQAERETPTSSETTSLRQQYELLHIELLKVDDRLMNVDLTLGSMCDELFALWDNLYEAQSINKVNELQCDFNLIASKLAALVYKGFALHVLRNRPLQSHSRLLNMCIEMLRLTNPMTVLTVIGEQSSAKSSLLNSTFGTNFRVSAGRCTIGLYLGKCESVRTLYFVENYQSKLYIVLAGVVYYKKMTIIILDTEGLMSLEESGSIFDNQMVTMAVLSSNLVIINHKGEISSNLEGLIGMSLYAKIQIQSSPFKPKLLFVLRDQTQRDMKIFQRQLHKLKDNIQVNGEFLRVSLDDELEMKHVVLMPGAFMEDTNRDYDIVQKWRTETFSLEINNLRATVFNCLEEQVSETAAFVSIHSVSNRRLPRRKYNSFLYSKLTINWKSIDDLGEGLLRCKSLYELSVQNELKAIAGSIITEQQRQLQIDGSCIIDELLKENIEQVRKDLTMNSELRPHIWVKEIIEQGNMKLNELTNRRVEEAVHSYEEQTQQSYFMKTRSQKKIVEASIKNMQRHLHEQLEIRAWETIFKTAQDYYRRELSAVIFVTGRSSRDLKNCVKQRAQQLEAKMTESLAEYKRSRKDITKATLAVYDNLIRAKNANPERTIYNLCPSLDYQKYREAMHKLVDIIDVYVKPYIEQTAMVSSPPTTKGLPTFTGAAGKLSCSLTFSEQNVREWFKKVDELDRNDRFDYFIFNVLLAQLNNHLNKYALPLVYLDPKTVDDLIKIIEQELHQAIVDTTSVNRPSLVHDLIIFMLYMLIGKTMKRIELKHEQLLNDTLYDLRQVEENVLAQLAYDKNAHTHAQLFCRILSKDIISEAERIHRQMLIEDLHTKLYNNRSLDPTYITRETYAASIAVAPDDPVAILKLTFDPTHFCLEMAWEKVSPLRERLLHNYFDDVKTTVDTCMRIVLEVVLSDVVWTDADALYKCIFQQIVNTFPDFQTSHTIEVVQEIQNPLQFRTYFENINTNDAENDSVLSEQLSKVYRSFGDIISREIMDILVYRAIGCSSCCPGCGIKCELPAEVEFDVPHNHSAQHHLPMAFHGWPCDKELHPSLPVCYQRWSEKLLFRGDGYMSSREEFFSKEAPDWYKDVNEKRQTGKACSENYPPLEHRRAWMAVRYKLIHEFNLLDQESYHSGIYPTSIVSVPSDYLLLWKPLTD